jgi:C1A family cysteine protease
MALSLLDLEGIIAASGASWTPGANPISRLGEDEKLLRTSGLIPAPIPPPHNREEVARSLAQSGAIGYPATLDWRNMPAGNFVTSVKDEGSCCACFVFAAAATVESATRIARGNPNLAVDYSEAHLLFCYGKQAGAGCLGGWWLVNALNAFKSGVVDEACFPYSTANQTCTLCGDWQTRLTYITAWHEITSASAMKDWIATRGPVATWMSVYTDFFSYMGGVYKHVNGTYYGGLCVTIVGYNEAERYWIAKNCWGTGWGEAGFFRIGYGECGIDAAMYAVDGIAETAWRRGVRIRGSWSIDQDRNVWVHVDQWGWRKLAADSDTTTLTMTAQLTAAKAAQRTVDLLDDRGVITQLYVY